MTTKEMLEKAAFAQSGIGAGEPDQDRTAALLSVVWKVGAEICKRLEYQIYLERGGRNVDQAEFD